MRLARAIFALPPALLSFAACDQALDQTQRADADADVSEVRAAPLEAASPIASRAAAAPDPVAPPVIAPVIAPAPTAVSTAVLATRRASAIRALNPVLGLVPGLVESLAAGELARAADSLALPHGVAELTGAPWLLLDGRLVLAQGDEIQPEWSAGVPELVKKPLSDDDGLFVARRALARQHLPSAMRALVGATVKVYDAEREVCVARVKDLGLEAEAIHFPDRWDDPDATTAKRVDHDATAVFDLGMPMLLGSLEPVIGTAADCAKGVWAAPIEAARPRLFRAVAMDKKLSKPAVRAYRKLAAWQERQAAFATFYSDMAPEKGRWDATAQHEITRFVADDGSREVLVVTANTNDGCGSSGQQLTALFDVVRDGKDVSLAPITARAWEGAPSGIVDLDADGQLELETDGTIFRWHGDRPAGNEQNGWVDRQYEQLERAVVPDLTIEGCGC